jgi:hypothetical protein
MNAISVFNSKGNILMDRLRSLADGKTEINLFSEINHAALDIIAHVIRIPIHESAQPEQNIKIFLI